MTETEGYFPRGGRKPVAAKFLRQNINFLGAPEKTVKKKKRTKKASKEDDGNLSDEVTVRNAQQYCANGVTYKTIKEGLLILGRIQNVGETKVKVALPSKIIGLVMACHISEPYNKQLEAYVNDQIDKVCELPQMFHPGQYVATKVLEIENEHVLLSMMPQHVNAGKTSADLGKGLVLQAAVSSVEDHGYVMDIGIPNTRAFLPKKNANPEIELDTGMICWCCVSSASPSPDTSIVTLASDLESLQKAITKRKNKTPLLPATPTLFTVNKPLENGIEGTIFGDTTAYIKRNQATSIKGKKPGLGQKVKAYLLYCMPPRQTPFLTMRDIFESTFPDLSREQIYREGDFVEDAQVIKISGRSVIFRLSPGHFGSMGLKGLQVNEDLTDEQVLAKSYPIGSSHKVRIIQYHLSDWLYSVSDSASVLNERYFSNRDVAVAEVVDAVVAKVADTQLMLAVGRLHGIVPHTHMSDAGFYVDPKKPSLSKLPKKKFKEGKELKARILSMDTIKNNLVLTVKPTLVNLPREEILTEYSEALIGKGYTGIIKYIRNDYILVSFFNHVTAFVPRNYVTKEEIDNLADIFHLGQIVNCTIIKVDAEAKKMVGSLTTTPFWPNKKRDIPVKRKHNDSSEEKQVPNKKRKPSKGEDNPQSTEVDKHVKKDLGIKKKDKKHNESKTETSNENDSSLKTKAQIDKVANDADTSKGKKKKDKQIVETKENVEETEVKVKRKKQRKGSESVENCDRKGKTEEITTKAKNKKNSKSKRSDEIKQTNTQTDVASDDENMKHSEESDAIETDVYEENILTPRDQGLVDFSDCETPEHYKKRIHSLKKSVAGKQMRIQKINAKIRNIETKGLTPKNKKFHTAMHMEKLVLEQSIEQLNKAITTVGEKLNELGCNKPKRKRNDSQTDSGHEDDTTHKNKNKKADKIRDAIKIADCTPVLEVPSAKEFWSTGDSNQHVQEDSSSSESEDEQQPKKKRKKLTVAEKLAKARQEEERVRELEARAASDELPHSSEQFERALLADPDRSQLWIGYMAFHLQSTEVEKARAVGKRALSTISFRQEHEKLNVCLALINMEIRFGTKETQQKAIDDALQTNDPYSIHSKLLDMYQETGQLQELSTLVDRMTSKYRTVDSYVACGGVCYKAGLLDRARQVMQKAIQVLDKKEHVNLLTQFALLERSLGSRDRAEAILEQVTAVYPRRVDVACAYADMLVKCGDLERVRQVLERMTSQKLPARKMKVLYKKWIEIEEKMGTPEQVESIRQRAMEFIEKAKF